jgi:hypothetical protein
VPEVIYDGHLKSISPCKAEMWPYILYSVGVKGEKKEEEKTLALSAICKTKNMNKISCS